MVLLQTIQKKCEKMYKNYKKAVASGKLPDVKMGVKYYEYLNNEIELSRCLYNNEIIYQSDNRKNLDLFILKSIKEQIEFELNDIKVYIDKVTKNDIDSTLYTYR